jgi:hypothetical protein
MYLDQKSAQGPVKIFMFSEMKHIDIQLFSSEDLCSEVS